MQQTALGSMVPVFYSHNHNYLDHNYTDTKTQADSVVSGKNGFINF